MDEYIEWHEMERSVYPKCKNQPYNLIIEQPRQVAFPKNLEIFEKRLWSYYHKLSDQYFDKLSSPKKVEELTYEKLIEILICPKKLRKSQYKGLKIDKKECYDFLKKAIERKVPFSEYTQKYLGIPIDNNNLTVPEKRIIAIQAAAQVLWYYKKSKIPSTRAMQKEVWNDRLFILAQGLINFKNTRVIENWIREVNPLPENERKLWPLQRKSLQDCCFDQIILIPGIFLTNPLRINFEKLRFAIKMIVQRLSSLSIPQEAIIDHLIFHSYIDQLQFYPQSYVKDWIKEAFIDSGSILS
jgi:hypothetical protein